MLLLLLLEIKIGNRKGTIRIANFGTRAVVWYKVNKGSRTRLPANEATFRYESFFVNYFGGTPTPSLSVCPWTKWLLIGAVSLSFYSFSSLLFFFLFPSYFLSFLFLLFFLCPFFFLPFFLSASKKIFWDQWPVVRFIFHPCSGSRLHRLYARITQCTVKRIRPATVFGEPMCWNSRMNRDLNNYHLFTETEGNS